MTIDQTVSAAGALGELRKTLKMYEALKDVEKIFIVLAETEARKRSLEKELNEAAQNLESIKSATTVAIEQKNQTLANLDQEIVKTNENIQSAKETSNLIMQAARKEAREIVDRAKQEVEQIKGSISTLRDEESKVGQELMKVKNQYHELVSEMKKQKEQLLKVFN